MWFEKNNVKTSFTHGVGKPASLGTLPSCKQSLTKPLSLCKIACVSTVNADTPQTVDWKLNFHFLGQRMRYRDARQ